MVDKRYIASCSFGKDSIAAILVRLQYDEPVDGVVYCRIMFDENTPAELPEHDRWIFEYAIPKLEKEYGLKTTVIQADKNYLNWFYQVKKRGKNKGSIYGFPFIARTAWCADRLKIKVIEKWSENKNVTQIVGIAYDENRALMKDKIYPLVEHKTTEAQAFEICEKAGLLSPAYTATTRRLGCWFCNKQRIGELKNLYSNYPDLWARLLEIEKESPHKFKPNYTISGLDKRFANENRQIKINEVD